MIDEILGLVRKHEEWRGKNCLNLIPSENVMSAHVRQLLSSELGNRYTARDNFYMGTQFIDEVEQYGEKIAKEIFKSQTADLRPLSGHVADLIFLASFAKPNDVLMCVSPQEGGYMGIWENGVSRLLGLRTVAFPFSKHDMNIKVEAAEESIRQIKPRILVFGASFMNFPHPIKELAEVAEENGAHIGFDGSHVIGLIAGGQFQDPLKEGASVLFGSTHKTLFGPQGGIILADKRHGEHIKEKIFPTFVDNAHWNRIAALTLALAETKKFGKAYAEQIIRNAKALAEALWNYGFPVVCRHLGFTQSHQVILDYGGYETGRAVAEKLQKANIIVDCGVRIGTCEVTRRGMKEEDMLKIAELIKRTAIDEEQSGKIKKEVSRLCLDFQKIQYCFEK